MSTNLLLEQMETCRTAILSAVGRADRVEAERKAFDSLVRSHPAGGPENPGSRTRWHLGSSTLTDDTGAVLGYTVSLAWVTAGVVTNAVVYVSTTGVVHSTSLSTRSVPRHEEEAESGPAKSKWAQNVNWSAPADERLDAVKEALADSGYRMIPTGSEVLALLDVAEGRSAGFLGLVADPAARMAASLLISEAHGQVSDWSGRYPALGDDTLVAGSHFTHYHRFARLLAGADRAAATDAQEVSRHA
ncbi:hypothetical protein [Kutzneria buriramensis]|uniref:Fructose-1,6-bisphosphatase/inositol monophosphatase family enzyme n=1 Tax=Kutzneria buriramensis TaxID=1045776 RepID=A0A3E0H0Q2_9PSEU|nr:hypothetical protein [Kutzneria buriramensis]REH36379.1 fructose-1,6-bisphosphatase/inositol monophosphatase family enzyme [Kutzneria buriramensis]